MAKKIKGQIKQWEEPLGVMNAKFVAAHSEVRESLRWEDATLVVGDERVFTESEVQDMLDDMRRMFREFRGQDGTAHGYATIDMMFVDEFVAILQKHGVSNAARGNSDPA